MAKGAWLGHKVRRLRQDHELSQIEMARRLDISPSYLNMIEHNRRPLTSALTQRLASTFEVDPSEFSRDDDARLMAELAELFSDTLFAERPVGRDEIQQAVTVAPTVCAAVAALFRAYSDARSDIEDLNDRLSEETFLATSAFEIRTLLTPIRSFAEILRDHDNLPADQRRTFTEILAQNSEHLSETISEMLELSAGERNAALERAAPASEQVSDYLQSRFNHFPDIEAAAQDLGRVLGFDAGNPEATLVRHLTDSHGITLLDGSDSPAGRGHVLFDPDRRTLQLSDVLPASSRMFRLAQRIGMEAMEDEFAEHSADPVLGSDDARALLREVLGGYFAAALLMPYEAFVDTAREVRYDIELLQRRFAASFEQVCHRLTTLQRPDEIGVPFHFIRVDIAGNVSKRFSLSGLRLPRHGGVCPRLNVHSGFMLPGAIDRQVARMPDGGVFFNIARTEIKPGWGHRSPSRNFAIMLGCNASHAGELVYSDGIDLDNDDAAVPIGMTCRMCERQDCQQRAFAPVLDRFRRGPERPEAGAA